MTIFKTFRMIKKSDISFSPEVLQKLPCGLFRAPFNEASEIIPEFKELIETCPIPKEEWNDWEIDIKTHMLFKGQYPCMPNWHCDNIPRNEEGELIYNYPIDYEEPPMFLWISGNPRTEFLSKITELKGIKDHGDLNKTILNLKPETVKIPEKHWCSFQRLTPHRGSKAEENTWRVFVRITHKSIAPQRPVYSHIRRHSQVYLESNFHW